VEGELATLEQKTGLPLTQEFSAAGVRQFGIFKLLEDLKTATAGGTDMTALGSIVPGQRGLVGLSTILSHLDEAKGLNRGLGGNEAGSQNPLGTGPTGGSGSGPDTLAGLNKSIRDLPPEMRDKFVTQLDNVAQTWRNDGVDYNKRVATENDRHAHAIATINHTSDEKITAKLESFGIKHGTADSTFALQEAAIYKKGSGANSTAVADAAKVHDAVIAGALSDYQRGRISWATYSKDVVQEDAYNVKTRVPQAKAAEKAAKYDESGAIKALEARYGIHANQAKEILDLSLKGIHTGQTDKLNAEDYKHRQNLSKDGDKATTAINGLMSTVKSLGISIRDALDPQKVFQGWQTHLTTVLDKATYSLAMNAFNRTGQSTDLSAAVVADHRKQRLDEDLAKAQTKLGMAAGDATMAILQGWHRTYDTRQVLAS